MSATSTAGKLIRRRLGFERDFTQIPNAWLRDDNLSYRSRGILALLMSHDSGWSVTVKTLAERSADGLAATRSAVQELERFGYLRREQLRTKRGMLSHTIWELCDPAEAVDNPPTPLDTFSAPEEPKNGPEGENPWSEPSFDFPSTGNPSTANPSTDNRTTKEEQLKNTSIGYFPEVSTEGGTASAQVRREGSPAGRCRHRFDPASRYCLGCGLREDKLEGLA